MKRLFIIMLILITCSAVVMADETETVDISTIPSNRVIKEKSTTISEEINQYFIWTIPSSVQLSGNTGTLTIEILEAHLSGGWMLNISVNNGTIQLENDYGSGSVVTLKQGPNVLEDEDIILSLSSSTYNANNNVERKAATIDLEVSKNKFQYAGKYTADLTFIASIGN